MNRFSIYGLLLVFVLAITISQDYIYSQLQDTGFYFSESLLYNTFWAFFIAFALLIKYLINAYLPKTRLARVLYSIGIGTVFSFLHITLFTSLFVLVSYLLFTPPHRFTSIFSTALSNQFYITFFLYNIAPSIYHYFLTSKRNTSKYSTEYPEEIKIKSGSKITTLLTSSIQMIATDKPYAVIHTAEQKFLQEKSLKEFEYVLDPTLFLRVHRSVIVNKNFINALISRKNGDYDATLENGQSIRLSRHLRENWKHLLQ